MSEVRLVIREAECDWSGTMHGSSVDRVIAALSADPVTLAELEVACARFEKPLSNRSRLVNLSPGLYAEPYDAGLVVIDLVARLVVVDSTYSSPSPVGELMYHDGKATDIWLRYHLAEDWHFAHDGFNWQGVAEQRRRERAVRPALDARSVFYGRPLLEYIARETFAAAACGVLDTAAEDTIREIHAGWLLTPRDDLRGECPRDVALARHDQLSWDLQDQSQRWSRLGQCPPGLDKSSFAFRYGGFGTHELVQYYDLVRELLWSCHERLAELREAQSAAAGPEAFRSEDFLASEIPRLERVRDAWLDTPDLELHGRTPRSVIDRERARLPEGMSGHEAIIDPDCPCCQMQADLPGPVFWHLDGCNMDDEFAFDIRHRTLEEWEAERREWEEHSQRFNAQWAERERLGVTGYGGEGEQSVWSSSFSVDDSAEVPLGIRLFGIGGHLAELITDLRENAEGQVPSPVAQQHIDQLNRDFGNVRELLLKSETSLTAALLEPVIDRFTESLASLATFRMDLTNKCESLASNLARFLEPAAPDKAWDSDEEEYPF